MFGIVTYKDPEHKVMYSYGTLVGIIQESPIARSESIFSNFFDNSFNTFYSNDWQLIVIGVERFKILSMTEENGHYIASIQIEKDKTEKLSEKLLQDLKNSARSYWSSLGLSPSQLSEKEKHLTTEKEASELGFIIADSLDIPVPEKQSILENFSLSSRIQKIINLCSSLISENQLTREISSKIKDEVASKLPSRQSLGGNKAELEKLEEKLLALELQPETKVSLTDELSRLKAMPKEHPEFNMIRNYLELAAALPWNTSSVDNYDIKNARSQLDSDHFGLEKVKKRIIEYIAVRGLRGDMKGSILCFTGPPGVGKTSMGKSIAASIGRKFFRVSLGGVRDEAEIRGHRRTYIGSLPGVFITVLPK
jgi:ATP-dependent Lon protease